MSDPERLKQHAQDVARAMADAGQGLVKIAIAQFPPDATGDIAARLASGESPAVTFRWRKDRVEVRVGLDGAGDADPTTLLAIDFAYRAPDELQ